MKSYCFGKKDSVLFCAPLRATCVATPTLLGFARNVVFCGESGEERVVGAMASRPIENLVLLTVSTCGRGGAELGSDEKEICLLAWQVIDTAKIQVGTKWASCTTWYSPTLARSRMLCAHSLWCPAQMHCYSQHQPLNMFMYVRRNCLRVDQHL